jgi:kinesin family member C2/C3
MQVRQSERGNYVPDLTTVQVHSMAEVLQLLALGDANRSSACTNMNEHSSRSHLMLTVQV